MDWVNINKKNMDRLAGITAATTARIWIVIALCAFQYWLLTATMEAYHAGNLRIPLFTFLASLICFGLALGLMVTGEKGARTINQELGDDQS